MSHLRKWIYVAMAIVAGIGIYLLIDMYLNKTTDDKIIPADEEEEEEVVEEPVVEEEVVEEEVVEEPVVEEDDEKMLPSLAFGGVADNIEVTDQSINSQIKTIVEITLPANLASAQTFTLQFARVTLATDIDTARNNDSLQLLLHNVLDANGLPVGVSFQNCPDGSWDLDACKKMILYDFIDKEFEQVEEDMSTVSFDRTTDAGVVFLNKLQAGGKLFLFMRIAGSNELKLSEIQGTITYTSIV